MSQDNRPPSNLSSKQAATLIGVRPQTLRVWRVKGKGPRYVRLGINPKSRVVYRVQEVNSWMENRSFHSTSEESKAAQLKAVQNSSERDSRGGDRE